MRTEEQVQEHYESYLALYAEKDVALYFGALGALGFTLGKTMPEIESDIEAAKASLKRRQEDPPVRLLSLIDRYGNA